MAIQDNPWHNTIAYWRASGSPHDAASICQVVCSVTTLWHLLLMQPHYFAVAYLCLYPYTKKLYMRKLHVPVLSPELVIPLRNL